MKTTSSQPRAIYYVVALQIWEYFSFYGMRALLILYLTNQLKYDDNHAYALFSAYCSLVYVTPILGGYLADKLLGTPDGGHARRAADGHWPSGARSQRNRPSLPLPVAGDHRLRLRVV
ncbi:hypothetical protein LNO81_07745 [Klebsiella variicola subsp. variicola]|nr:hypothetical protein [Klebsiella variicola subsp. variicola]